MQIKSTLTALFLLLVLPLGIYADSLTEKLEQIKSINNICLNIAFQPTFINLYIFCSNVIVVVHDILPDGLQIIATGINHD